MTDAAKVVIACTGEATALLVRIATAAGHDAEAVDLDHPTADELAEAVTSALAGRGADAALLDVGAETSALIGAIRSHDDPVVSTCRLVVLGDGPAGGRLAWQAGADALLIRPFHVDDLRAEIAATLARPDGERAATRAAGLASLAEA